MVSEAEVLNALSKDKSLTLFDSIAVEGRDTAYLMKWSKLNRKGYYSRISALIKSGLIEKRNGKYYLTSFGEVALGARELIGSGIEEYWKLKAINSIGLGLPQHQRNQIIEALIHNQNVKEILLRKASDVVTYKK
jgi:predicted transcriptional regulator